MILQTSENLIGQITFQVTEACNCKCSYCYQINKSQSMMTKDIADQAINFLFSQECHIGDAIKFVFVGGEPFLNIEIIDYICSIFLDKCMRDKHIWSLNWAIEITTNGLNYFDEPVQNFIKKFQYWLQLNISIDGNLSAHDKCRKQIDNTGSFEQAWAALNNYRDIYNTDPYVPMVISPSNLPDFYDSIKFLTNNKYFNIQPNLIYEHLWTADEAHNYYEQLLHLADDNINLNTIFKDTYYTPLNDNQITNWCGGNGQQLVITPNGELYPCIRYTPSSLSDNQNPFIIGDVQEGFYKGRDFDIIKYQLQNLNRRNQTTDKCYYCPIAAGCSWCPAYNYHCTGNFHERNTNICLMHAAQAAANYYYWTKQGQKKHLFLPKDRCLQFMNEIEYRRLINAKNN